MFNYETDKKNSLLEEANSKLKDLYNESVLTNIIMETQLSENASKMTNMEKKMKEMKEEYMELEEDYNVLFQHNKTIQMNLWTHEHRIEHLEKRLAFTQTQNTQQKEFLLENASTTAIIMQLRIALQKKVNRQEFCGNDIYRLQNILNEFKIYKNDFADDDDEAGLHD
jgi:chromosome segregation ATPase